MKTYILIASASLLMLSCNNSELERSKHQKDSLMSVIKQNETNIKERETSLNEYVTSFSDVERNLDSVAAKQQIIYSSAGKSGSDLKGNQKERINANINAINDLMNSNRKTIAQLRRKLKNSNNKNKELEETITSLTDRLAQKDIELAALNDKLTSLNMQVAQLQTTIDTLMAQNTSKSQTIDRHITSLHTAYYIVGKSKDLREAKVIDRKGGLLGIGKTEKLSENFNQSKFTRIDYIQTNTIPVNSNHVKIITNHPPDAYKLEKDPKDDKIVKNLVITNAEKFWSVSKYLVIEGSPVKVDNAVSGKSALKENKY